jgi:hypothetical protein
MNILKAIGVNDSADSAIDHATADATMLESKAVGDVQAILSGLVASLAGQVDRLDGAIVTVTATFTIRLKGAV